MRRIYILFILALMFCAVPVSAQYLSPGGDSGRFIGDDADIIKSTDMTAYSAFVSNPIGTPLYADIDTDGTNEIVVGGTNDIYVYNYTGSTLNVEASGSVPGTADIPPVIHDIDDDPYLEIITNNGTNAAIFEYNGTDVYMEHELTLSVDLDRDSPVVGASDITNMGCYEAQCYAVRVFDHYGTDGGIFVSRFNTTTEINYTSDALRYGNNDVNRNYFHAPSFVFDDVDADGGVELAFTTLAKVEEFDGDDDIYHTEGHHYDLDLSSHSHALAEEFAIQGDDGSNTDASHAIWGNGDGVKSNGLEILSIAYDQRGRTGDSYVVSVHDSDGSRIRTMPSTTSLNTITESGTPYVSTPANSDFFPNTGDNDVCYSIYDAVQVDENGTIQNVTGEAILCASLTTDTFYRWHFFRTGVELTDPYTYTTYDLMNMMVHAVDSDSNPEQFADTIANSDEYLTHQGLIDLDWGSQASDNIFTTNYHDADLVYELPRTFGAVTAFDYENVSRADLILLMPEFVYYIDDGFVNQGAEIDGYEINPCLDYAWLTNETVKVTITATDREDDSVQARAKLYEGRTYEQDSNWSSELGSGSSASFFFTANHTTSSADLLLMARDTENPDDIAEITLNFQVSDDGVEYGFCKTTETGLTEPEEEEEEEEEAVPGGKTESAEDNSINNALNELKGDSGLSSMVLWIIIMAVVAGSIIFYLPGSMTHNHMFALIGIVEVFLLILGAHLGFISTGVIVVLVILALGAGAMWFRRQFTGSYN